MKNVSVDSKMEMNFNLFFLQVASSYPNPNKDTAGGYQRGHKVKAQRCLEELVERVITGLMGSILMNGDDVLQYIFNAVLSTTASC